MKDTSVTEMLKFSHAQGWLPQLEEAHVKTVANKSWGILSEIQAEVIKIANVFGFQTNESDFILIELTSMTSMPRKNLQVYESTVTFH